jgi:hypothetical protein
MIVYYILPFIFISFSICAMEQPEVLTSLAAHEALTFAEAMIEAKSIDEKIALINSCDANKCDNSLTPLHALCILGMQNDDTLKPHILKLIDRTQDINHCIGSGSTALHAAFFNARCVGDLEPFLRAGAIWDPKKNGTAPLRLLKGMVQLKTGLPVVSFSELENSIMIALSFSNVTKLDLVKTLEWGKNECEAAWHVDEETDWGTKLDRPTKVFLSVWAGFDSPQTKKIKKIGRILRAYYNTMHGLGYVQPPKDDWCRSQKFQARLPLDIVKKIAYLGAQVVSGKYHESH